MSEDSLVGRGIKTTIKYGKGFEHSWLSVAGTPSEVAKDIAESFGIDGEGLTVAELVHNASQLAQAFGNSSKLGATAMPTSNTAGSAPNAPDEAQADPWAAAAAGEAANPNQALYDTIASISDVASLKLLHAENGAAFAADADLLAAWKAKGKALTAAAS